LGGHTDWVTAIAVSLDGQRIVSGGYDGTLRLWHLAEGESCQVGEHESEITAVAFAPERKAIISGSRYALRFWDLTTGENSTLDECTKGVIGVVFDPEGRLVVASASDARIRLQDFQQGRLASSRDTSTKSLGSPSRRTDVRLFAAMKTGCCGCGI
jgi:WD40 repeat protein